MANDDEMLVGTPATDDADFKDLKSTRDDLEIVQFAVEFDLVPDWSNVLERICQHNAVSTKSGVLGDSFVVKAAVAPEKREELMHIIETMWGEFARRRKLRGDWHTGR